MCSSDLAFIERKDVTYSYEDGDLYHFMDNETYDDIPVNAADVPDNFKFCKENELCKLLSYKGKVFSVEIPNFIAITTSPIAMVFATVAILVIVYSVYNQSKINKRAAANAAKENA